MVSISQHISILFSLAVGPMCLSYTVLRVVIFEYKYMHVVFEYKYMHLQTDKKFVGAMPKTVNFHL